MRYFFKAVFGLALAAVMMLPMISIASAATDVSIDVSGHILNGDEPAAKFHIYYDANGGTGSYNGPDIESGGADTVLSLSQTGIARGGHTFTGWNTLADGGGTPYKEGDIITLDSSVILYAQWTKEAAGRKNPGNGGTDTAKTGDTGNIPLLAVLLFASFTAMIFLLWAARREKRKNIQGS